MNMKRMILAVTMMFAAATIAALPTKFRWDDVVTNGEHRCYTTPVKTQTGPTDRSYAYAMMDYLETLRLIRMGKDYNSLADYERENALGPVESAAANAEKQLGAFGGKWYDEVPVMEKSLDWMLRSGFYGQRVTDITFPITPYHSSDIGGDKWQRTLTAAKELLRTRGPFVVGYLHVDEYMNDGKYYYLPDRNSIYEYVDEADHHRTALVVGYDDTVPASVFATSVEYSTRPAGPGAWIIKGSRGISEGEKGYYYVSYYDFSFLCYTRRLGALTLALFELAAKVVNVDWDEKYGDIYCNDTSTPSGFWGGTLNSGGSSGFANMFTAESDGTINALGFWMDVVSGGTYITVSVYVGCEAAKPFTGRSVFSHEKLWFPSSGYHAIPLPESLCFEVKAGQRFSVVLEYGSNYGFNNSGQNLKSTIAFQSSDEREYGRSFWWTYSPDELYDMAEGNSLLNVADGWVRTPSMCFITAYTENDKKEIVLRASDGEIEDGILLSWNRTKNGVYDIYRAEKGKTLERIVRGCRENSYLDKPSNEGDKKPWPDVFYDYKVIDVTNEIESNVDSGIWGTKPQLLEVKPAKLWLTGEGPYNVKLIWNKYNKKIFDVKDGEFNMEQPGKTAKHYRSKIQVIRPNPDYDRIVDLASGGGVIESGNHGEYKMTMSWKYTNKASGRTSDGDVKKDITVKVYFPKYKKDDGLLANWFYNWPNDGAIDKQDFRMGLYCEGARTQYDDGFYYSDNTSNRGYTDARLFDEQLVENTKIKYNPWSWWPGDVYLQIYKATPLVQFYVTDLAAAVGDVISPSRYPSFTGQSVGKDSKGLARLADVLEHEMRHRDLYKQLYSGRYFLGCFLIEKSYFWGLKTEHDRFLEAPQRIDWSNHSIAVDYPVLSKYAGKWVQDLDGDGVSDEYENNSLQRFGIQLDPSSKDTYNVAAYYNDYSRYGDNEFLARKAESDDTVKTFPENDWAFPGNKIAQMYQGHQNTRHRGYDCWTDYEATEKQQLQEDFSDGSDTAGKRTLTTSQKGVTPYQSGVDDASHNSGTLSRYSEPTNFNPVFNVLEVVSVGEGIAQGKDESGHYASLVYSVAVTNLTGVGQSCVVRGYLLDCESNAVAWASVLIDVPSNTTTTNELIFAGENINMRNSRGYALARVTLEPIESNYGAIYDTIYVMAQTDHEYHSSDFTPPAAKLDCESISEELTEDALSIRMGIAVNTEETLRLAARLSDTNGQFIANASKFVTKSDAFADLSFSKEQIAYSRCCGPFVVSLVQVLRDGEVICGGRNVYTTREYDRDAFQLEDRILSIDEQSFVRVGQSVTHGAAFAFDVSNRTADVVTYRVKALLFGTNDTYICSAVTNIALEAGINTLTLVFDENEVVGSISGPYWVREVVFDPAGDVGERDHFYPTPLYFDAESMKTAFVFTQETTSAPEGDIIEIGIAGGTLESASSVNVYLTYNTAAAADLDLAKGAVDGETPRGGLKFPLTLTWAAGEIGEKVITIPVKTDKTVEGDEFFTLQLATPQGMALGENRVCTVMIKDANTYTTLQDGVMNPNIKVTSKGDRAWLLGDGSSTDTKGLSGLYHLESPPLAQGESATFSLGSLKGNGKFYFHLRFTGDTGESVPSKLAVYDGNDSLGYVDHTVMTNGWIKFWITDDGWTASTTHTYSFVFTQGSDPNTHAEIAEIGWINGDIASYRVLTMSNTSNGGYVNGSGLYEKGQTAKFSAKPFPGWSFDGWYAVEYDQATDKTNYSFWNKSASVSYKVTTNFYVTAFFSKIPYVRGLADPADGGKVSGSGLCDKGKKVTLKATANKNFTFLGWGTGNGEWGTGNGERGTGNRFVATTPSLVIDRSAKPAASSKTSTTITNVTEDVTYYAVFKSDPEVFVTVDVADEKGADPTGKGAGKYVAGTITGMGKYAPGKTKIALKATANKGYVFVGWHDANGMLLTKDATYTIASMGEDDVEYTAKFVTAEDDKGSITLAVNGEEMRLAEEGSPYRTNVWTGVYLEWPVTASALSATTVKVAGLPAGLKFADKPVTSKVGTGKAAVTVTNVPANTIYGAPSAASKTTVDKKTGATTVTPSAVKVTVTTAGKSSQTYQIDTIVDPLPAWAVGTFYGAMLTGTTDVPSVSEEPDPAASTGETPVVPVNGQDARSPSGIVSLTVSAAGKVSGKAQGDGLAYTLAAPYYSGFAVVDDGESLISNFLADVTASWSYKDGSKTVKTNDVVQLIVRDNGVGGVALGGSRPVATEVADATERVPPSWTAWQYNWVVEPWKTLGTSFDKKPLTYAILSNGTFSESDEHVDAALGEEVTGRVTLKFSAKGTVTVTGEFVFGYDEKKAKYTTVKASGSATLVPMDSEHGAVFIYLTPKGLPPHARALTVPWPVENM